MKKIYIAAFWLIGLLLASFAADAQLIKYTSKDTLNGKPKFEGALKGRLKLNGIYDISGNLHGNSAFLIHENNVNGQNRPGIWMDMRQSQLRFDGTQQFGNGKQLFARLEADFEGGPDGRSNFRIRHAFVEYGKWLVGQTWSTFGDGDMWPASLFDWDGPTGMVESRRPMIRFTDHITSALQYQVAAEVMEPRRLNDYTTNEWVGNAPKRLPDFVGTLKWNLNPGFIKVAGIYRNISYDQITAHGDKSTSTITKSAQGYGVSAMTSLFLGKHKKNNFQAQVNHGKGIADYFLAVGGSKLDGYPGMEETNKLRLLPVNAAYISYQQYWTPRLHSLFIASMNRFDGKNTTTGWNTMQNLYAGANLMVDVVPGLTVGAEYLWGKKILDYADGGSKSKNAQRVNFGIMYNF